MTWDELKSGLESGRIWGLYLIERDPAAFGAGFSRTVSESEFNRLQSPFKGVSADAAHFRLPATAYVEEGALYEFRGTPAALRARVEPVGQAQPDWAIFHGLREARCRRRARAAAR